MTHYLSVDYGGTNTKAIIFDEKGKQVAVSSFQTLRIEDSPGHREVDLDETWQAISQAIKTAIDQSGIAPSEIKAVSCIGHGKGLYLLDKSGQEFTHGILSTDERASQLASDFESRVDEIWGKTRQHIVAVQNPVLLAWLKANRRELYEQVGWILSAKDYVRFKLTSQINQEYGDASGNHWINFEKGGYDPAILDFFGIPEMFPALPPLVDYKDIVGGVSAEAAGQTGLVEGTPVIGGLFDIDACAIGSGVVDDQTISIIAGTWNINTYPSKAPADRSSGLMTSYFPNRDYLIEASSPTSAGNLDIILKMLMAEEIQNLEATGSETIYDTLEVFLTNTAPSFSKLIFLPFLYGSNVGQPAEACFLGLTSTSTKSEMLRAVYEGVVFAHKQHLDQLMNGLKSPAQILRLSGGATNSRAWMQMFADILGLTVETVDATELGGLGGAIACLQALEGLELEVAIDRMVRRKERFEPDAEAHDIYQDKYQVYQSILKALKPVWAELCHLQEV